MAKTHPKIVINLGLKAYPDIIVADAGTEEVNGTYVFSSTLNGRPHYVSQKGCRIQFTSLMVVQWDILCSNNIRVYSANDDALTPDLVETWFEVNGDLPVPELSVGNEEDIVVFEENDIVSANVVQEVNPISVELPISTLTFSIHSRDIKYSMFAMGKFQDKLSRRMPVLCYEIIDSSEHLIGLFYLDEWKNVSEWEFEFDAVDLIGLLEREKFLGLFYDEPTTVENILNDVLSDITENYEIVEEVKSIELQGWITPGTYRDALRQVLFAAQAAAVTAKSDKICITKTRYPVNDQIYDYHISKSYMLMGRSVDLLPMVTSMEFTTHDWIASDIFETLFEGTVGEGTFEFRFDKPYYDYDVIGEQKVISSFGPNHIIITSNEESELIVRAKPYLDATNKYIYENPLSTEDDKRNDLAVEEAYLINPTWASSGIVEDIMVYFMQRHRQDFETFGESSLDINLMDMPVVSSLYDQEIRGIIKRLVIDLTGGFRVKAYVVGVEHSVQLTYIGTEDGRVLATEDYRRLIVRR